MVKERELLQVVYSFIQLTTSCQLFFYSNDICTSSQSFDAISPNAGELIFGLKKTLFMDEISTGLDSLTTFQIVK